jgi:type IV fimbrial biogenesis protein FimT
MRRANPTHAECPAAAARASSTAAARGGCAGFTLIELAVTLTVFALLMAAVAPMAGAWVANMQIRSTAEALQMGLQKARMEAVRRNRNVQFSLISLTDPTVVDNSCALASNAASWVVSFNDPAGKCGNALSDSVDPMNVQTYASGAPGRRVTVSAVQSDGVTAATSVTFDGFGRVTGGGAIARIDVDNVSPGDDFRPLRLVINSGGAVRMCEPRVTDANDPRFC